MSSRELARIFVSRADAQRVAERLLDIVMTSYNVSLVTPAEGEGLAAAFESNKLSELEVLELLLELAYRTEPEKLRSLIEELGQQT
ncbi:MAG: hypothetical protein NZ988_05240 [Thaumarchaeota archaeon]|nr:hypothetical protein [Candidatus Calditenuaceae archaeon]MDW8187431.1 hypothetical protein [Nitrososphaerota archaeon]